VTPTPAPETPSISSRDFWSRPPTERARAFAELRRTTPVSYQQPTDFGLTRPGSGYWAVTRHADVQQISRSPELFCSGQGVGLADVPQEFLELNASFLVMDAPRHTKLRKAVSRAFTPRRVGVLSDAITAEAGRIIDEFVERGSGDVVQDLAMKLPLWTISSMLGIPESMRGEFYRASEAQLASQDPEFAGSATDAMSVAMEAATTLHRLAHELIALRRQDPGDDILSTLVHTELDGEPLTDLMLGGIFVLFATAGNDTTRNTTSHTVKAFSDNPDQWSALRREPALIESAVEEMVRWASPVIHFRRTATADTELSGIPIAAGDPVVMFYESANRDEAAFSEPGRFDISRSPNPHVAFGGGGAHFCLGANLARVQLRALFSCLARQAVELDAGEPAYLVSNFVNGIKRMPVTIAT
jgi:cytochrome P450